MQGLVANHSDLRMLSQKIVDGSGARLLNAANNEIDAINLTTMDKPPQDRALAT